jgi:hypothetical protein
MEEHLKELHTVITILRRAAGIYKREYNTKAPALEKRFAILKKTYNSIFVDNWKYWIAPSVESHVLRLNRHPARKTIAQSEVIQTATLFEYLTGLETIRHRFYDGLTVIKMTCTERRLRPQGGERLDRYNSFISTLERAQDAVLLAFGDYNVSQYDKEKWNNKIRYKAFDCYCCYADNLAMSLNRSQRLYRLAWQLPRDHTLSLKQ